MLFFVVWYVFALSLVVSFMWQQPMPMFYKVGMGMVAHSLLMLLGAGLYFFYDWMRTVYREVMETVGANCLVWRHPDNTQNGMATLELVFYPVKTELETKSEKLQKLLTKWQYFLSWGSIKKAILKTEALIKTTIPIGGADWFYKYYWFMPEKRMKWMYEFKDEKTDKFVLKPYNPDLEISRKVTIEDSKEKKTRSFRLPTSGELAAALDTTVLKRIEGRRLRNSTMEKLATGAIIAMPAVCVLAMLMLTDMLKQGGA